MFLCLFEIFMTYASVNTLMEQLLFQSLQTYQSVYLMTLGELTGRVFEFSALVLKWTCLVPVHEDGPGS